LASEDHLAKWVESKRRDEWAVALKSRELIHDFEVSLQVTEWAYQQNEAVQGMTWVEGRNLVRLSPSWRQHLSMTEISKEDM
jgi:hypothetical protein